MQAEALSTMPAPASVAPALLEIADLRIRIAGIDVIDGVSLSADPGKILAIVGESGCGKSLTALSILRLLPKAARITSGWIRLEGDELTALDERALQGLRGNRASIIFQEPIASLNPLMRVGAQVEEALKIHRGLSNAQARREAIEMLARVGISEPELRARQYPFELSGGMCQRVMIAAALVCRPRLLIADEPTTALDVTIQAQILDLMKRLRDDVGTTILLVTHDLGVVAEMADDVAVMYGGRVIESGPVDVIFAAPAHPYTRLLLETVPKLDGPRKTLLRTIKGMVPSADAWPEGCRFQNRCPLATSQCTQKPELAPVVQSGHQVACWHTDRVVEMA
jgi:peptide/nickel transport system ATP-binding protein